MEPHENSFHAQRYISITDSYKSERWCNNCWLLTSHCICASIFPVTSSPLLNFHLLIHYKEYKKTSNTGILLRKLFPNSGLYISGIEEDKQKLFQTLSSQKNTCVLYPGEKSMPLNEWVSNCEEGTEKNFILLDSTWNQGRKLLNSLDNKFQRVKIVTDKSSLIKCKKQTNKGFLSTLECAAYVLKSLGDLQGFENIMNAFTLKDKAVLKQTHKHSFLKSLEDKGHYEIDP